MKQILQEFGVLLDDFVPAVQRGAGLPTQLFNLVANAFFGTCDGALNCWVDFGDGFVQVTHALLQLAETAFEFSRKFLWHLGGMHALEELLFPLPNVFQLQAIFFENASGFWINEREIGSRKNYGHAAK